MLNSQNGFRIICLMYLSITLQKNIISLVLFELLLSNYSWTKISKNYFSFFLVKQQFFLGQIFQSTKRMPVSSITGIAKLNFG